MSRELTLALTISEGNGPPAVPMQNASRVKIVFSASFLLHICLTLMFVDWGLTRLPLPYLCFADARSRRATVCHDKDLASFQTFITYLPILLLLSTRLRNSEFSWMYSVMPRIPVTVMAGSSRAKGSLLHIYCGQTIKADLSLYRRPLEYFFNIQRLHFLRNSSGSCNSRLYGFVLLTGRVGKDMTI